jgi:hypothetical protein
MSDEHESVLVKLTRMEGKLDLSNLRHDQHDNRFAAIDGRMNSHGERISGLEKREFGRDSGDRRISAAGKTLWLAIGSIPGGLVVAALMKAFGL